MKIGNPFNAESLYADALKAYIHHFGLAHADVALATLNLAECVATQALLRGKSSGALGLLERSTKLFQLAKERFSHVRAGAVSGSGAEGITREQRMAHCDRSLQKIAQVKAEIEQQM